MDDSDLPLADVYNLQRFIAAQEGIYEQVVGELSRGRKTSHWMWFIFPQIAGLGGSPTAVRYAIQSLAEARAHLGHSVLGARLHECCELLGRHAGCPIGEVMPWPDDLKLRSSMTLFARAAPDSSSFLKVLDLFFDGEMDQLTLDLLARKP